MAGAKRHPWAPKESGQALASDVQRVMASLEEVRRLQGRLLPCEPDQLLEPLRLVLGQVPSEVLRQVVALEPVSTLMEDCSGMHWNEGEYTFLAERKLAADALALRELIPCCGAHPDFVLEASPSGWTCPP